MKASRAHSLRFGRPLARPGFTLLELLVVVVIITLLLAILVPSLSRAKLASGRAACAAQLHGIGAGLRAYLNDNNDIMPWAAEVPSVNYQPPIPGLPYYQPIWLVLQTEVPSPQYNWPPSPTAAPAQRSVWMCNADRNGITNSYGTFSSWYAGEGTSYEYHMGMAGQKLENYVEGNLTGSGGFVQRMSQVQQLLGSSGTYLLADFSSFHDEKGQVPSKNLLYADFHVGNVSDISKAAGTDGKPTDYNEHH